MYIGKLNKYILCKLHSSIFNLTIEMFRNQRDRIECKRRRNNTLEVKSV